MTDQEAIKSVVADVLAGDICAKDWTKGWVEHDLVFPSPFVSGCLHCGGNGVILLSPCEQCAGTGWKVTAKER